MLRSKVGKPTTIKIRLHQTESGVFSASAKKVHPEHRTRAVLLVEDNPLVMARTAALLEN